MIYKMIVCNFCGVEHKLDDTTTNWFIIGIAVGVGLYFCHMQGNFPMPEGRLSFEKKHMCPNCSKKFAQLLLLLKGEK